MRMNCFQNKNIYLHVLYIAELIPILKHFMWTSCLDTNDLQILFEFKAYFLLICPFITA